MIAHTIWTVNDVTEKDYFAVKKENPKSQVKKPFLRSAVNFCTLLNLPVTERQHFLEHLMIKIVAQSIWTHYFSLSGRSDIFLGSGNF